MKRFEFRLEKVRRLRVAAEREALADLARALGGVREAEEKLRGIAARRGEVLRLLDRRLQEGRIDVVWMDLHHRDLERLDGEEDRTRAALDAARRAYDEARESLRAKQGDRKALDSLFDRERERHDEEVRREEGIVQDEIAISRHGKSVS